MVSSQITLILIAIGEVVVLILAVKYDTEFAVKLSVFLCRTDLQFAVPYKQKITLLPYQV